MMIYFLRTTVKRTITATITATIITRTMKLMEEKTHKEIAAMTPIQIKRAVDGLINDE